MTDVSSFDASTLVRSAVVKLGATAVLELVDGLNLAPSGRVDPKIVLPLQGLRKSRSLESFATKAPLVAVGFIVETLTEEALHRVIEILGDSSEDPSFEELSSAVDELLTSGFDASVVAAMLALASANNVPAETHCRRLLSEREALALSEVSGVAPASLLVERTIDPIIKEQRRVRREAEKRARRDKKEKPLSPSPKVKAPRVSAEPELVLSVPDAVLEVDRRRPLLTPLEEATVTYDAELAGSVIEMDVPYSNLDPENPTEKSKVRPVVVIAAGAQSLLVRALYSEVGLGRVSLPGWNRAGLAHPSFVAAERLNLARSVATGRLFGQISVEDWNQIL